MKINYVLLEDVKCKRREAREALEARTQNKNIQVGESMIGREPAQPPVGRMISEAELGLMNEIVKQSGYFERNKTRDVHQDLIREFIRLELSLLDTLSFSLSLSARLVAFQEPLTSTGTEELKSVLSRRATGFADSLTVLQLLPQSDRDMVSSSV